MKQSEIWLIDLVDPTKGAEIQKKRAAIIVNDNVLGKLPLKVVVPITDWKDRYNMASWMVQLTPNAQNGLPKNPLPTVFKCVRSHKNDSLKNGYGG